MSEPTIPAPITDKNFQAAIHERDIRAFRLIAAYTQKTASNLSLDIAELCTTGSSLIEARTHRSGTQSIEGCLEYFDQQLGQVTNRLNQHHSYHDFSKEALGDLEIGLQAYRSMVTAEDENGMEGRFQELKALLREKPTQIVDNEFKRILCSSQSNAVGMLANVELYFSELSSEILPLLTLSHSVVQARINPQMSDPAQHLEVFDQAMEGVMAKIATYKERGGGGEALGRLEKALHTYRDMIVQEGSAMTEEKIRELKRVVGSPEVGLD